MPRPFTLDDMAAIEERMKKLIDQDYDAGPITILASGKSCLTACPTRCAQEWRIISRPSSCIGPGLAKNTVAGRVNDRLVDACDLITEDSTLQIGPITILASGKSCLTACPTRCAQEWRIISRPSSSFGVIICKAKMVIGPVIEEGFYYDIWMPRPFTLDDMAAIEESCLTACPTRCAQEWRIISRPSSSFGVIICKVES
jgi:hypothetical protein